MIELWKQTTRDGEIRLPEDSDHKQKSQTLLVALGFSLCVKELVSLRENNLKV